MIHYMIHRLIYSNPCMTVYDYYLTTFDNGLDMY